MRFPSPTPTPLPLTRMTEAPERGGRISATQPGRAAVSPPAPGADPNARLHTAHRGQVSEGKERLLLTPALAPLRPDPPSASLGQELRRVYSYGRQATGEVAQKRGPRPCTRPWPRPKAHPSCQCPLGRTEGPSSPISARSIFPRKTHVVSTLAFTPTLASSKPNVGFWQSQG